MTAPFNDRIDQDIAAGGETQFDYTFPIDVPISPALHGLTVQTLTGTVEVTLVEGVDYSVTGAGNPGGGTIVLDTGVFPAGAIAGVGWTIFSSTAVSRATDFQIAGDFFAVEVNTQMDKLTHIAQDQDRDIGLALKLQLTGTLKDITFPAPGADEFIRWNSLGTALQTSPFVTIGGAIGVDETSSDPTKDKLVSDLLAQNWTLTTKGDLRTYGPDDTRLPIGTNGQRLVPNSAVDKGVEWANQITTDNKAGAYLVIASDQCKLIGLSSTSFTVDLTSAATLGAGFTVGFHHNGTTGANLYTIDPAGAENIDDDSTLILDTASESVWIVSDGANWHVTARNTPKLKHSVQQVSVVDGALATGTTPTLTIADTIPQNDEGDEFMTLSITPKNVNNILVIEIIGQFAHSTTADYMLGALFQDSIADALSVAQAAKEGAANTLTSIHLRHIMTAGTLSSTTFKFRAGSQNAGTTSFNGQSGARIWGGVSGSSMIITEYIA